ncbi:MAG: DUF885 domain-containing protein [Betaproteobacteria bacterium]|nr:DUF885 domain-containing protein [Betaproteobacteria bacterium]
MSIKRALLFCYSLLCATMLLAAPPLPLPAPLVEGKKLANIAERYFQDSLTLNPLSGSQITGDAKYEDKLAITISPQYIAQSKALLQRVAKELETVNAQSLSTSDRLTYDLLKEKTRDELEGYNYPNHLLPINHQGGLAVYIAQLGNGQGAQPFKTTANYRNYLKRLERLPVWVDQAIMNMKEGAKAGVVQPRILMERALPSLKALTEKDIEKSPFYTAITIMPASFTAADRKQLTSAYRSTIETKLRPAMERLLAFIEKDYLPQCRTTAGLGGIPGGDQWYAYNVRHHTTTGMTPQEIHTLGLSEVTRIRAEMEKVKAAFKFEGSLTDFLKWADKNPQFKPYKTEQEVLDAFAALNEKVMARLPDLFGRTPRAKLEIRPEPELTRATASHHYGRPPADGSRPGVFYAVIEDPTQFSTTIMTALFLHEGQPGHHYHLSLQQELSLPKFRQFGGITAYTEGWALYAETLGREMGLYDDPNAYLGLLNLELLRAVRLVTDTGLHSQGWTREQSIQYMIDTQGISEGEARRATERYMASPGQALAYKIGALKIQALRERASSILGDKFSLREFHDQVLSEGSLTMPLLEAKIDTWIGLQRLKYRIPLNGEKGRPLY